MGQLAGRMACMHGWHTVRVVGRWRLPSPDNQCTLTTKVDTTKTGTPASSTLVSTIFFFLNITIKRTLSNFFIRHATF
jgi:hypothetical protein